MGSVSAPKLSRVSCCIAVVGAPVTATAVSMAMRYTGTVAGAASVGHGMARAAWGPGVTGRNNECIGGASDTADGADVSRSGNGIVDSFICT